jgi:hypothetical protein
MQRAVVQINSCCGSAFADIAAGIRPTSTSSMRPSSSDRAGVFLSQRRKDEPMSESINEFELKPGEHSPMAEASDATVSRGWRRRLDAILPKEFVNGFVKTCLLSLIAFGPLPPIRERRNH